MAILLYVPGTETLPIAIFSFIDNGTFERAAAVSVVLILLSIVSVLRCAGCPARRTCGLA